MKVLIFAGVSALLGISVALSLQSAETFDYNDDDLTGRIIGGQTAVRDQFKYQTAIFVESKSNGSLVSFCNGALISRDYVLTVAQCIPDDLSDITIDVWFGAWNLSAPTESGRETNSIDFLFIHPEFDRTTLENDITVLHLQTRVELAPFIQPIQMAAPTVLNETYINITVRFSGWGARMDLGNLTERSDVLQFADNEGRNLTECEAYYLSNGYVLDDTNICMTTSGGRGPCKNDYGDPVTLRDGPNTLIGLLSAVDPTNCLRGAPVIFTKVAAHWDFIYNVTGLIPPASDSEAGY